MKKTVTLVVVAAVVIALALAGYAYYELMVRPVVPEATTVSIPRGSTYEDVVDSLARHGITPDRTFLDPLAERMNYRRATMRSGRFAIPEGLSMVGLVRRLRGSAQATVDVVLTTEREPMNVAAKVARFLAPDSLAFVQLFRNEAYLDSIGYTPETLQTLFIPNTYEMYWNATPREFVSRMIKEHDRFWSADGRRTKAEKLGMTPAKVYTLASIVEKESLQSSERPRMAGVYLNRLRRGIPLQADPTVVFALRQFDLGRVLYRHLEVDSPYNTYRNAGLPPGPITMASRNAINAVLNAEEHDYLYFVARGDGSGLHNYARTGAGHGRNIAIYRANLRERGIR